MPSAAATRLRPYQTDALDALTGAIEDGSRDLLLESPVGSGKTTMVKALAALLLAGAHRLIVVLVPQNLLKEQWARAGSWVVGDAPVTLPSGRTIETTRELTPAFWTDGRGLAVLTRAALTRVADRIGALSDGALDGVLVVADEGHHCAQVNTSGQTLAALRAKGAATLLVSATPWATAGAIHGSDTFAHRLAAAAYVCSFAADDPARPPTQWVVDRVHVGAAVDDATLTIDRGKVGAAKPGTAADKRRARETCAAMAERWRLDGFPRVVMNVPRKFWRPLLERALAETWTTAGRKGAPNVLSLIGDADLKAAAPALKADSDARTWGEVKIDAILSCARMDEGTDWVPCSHVYNAGIPTVAGLILQRWGRASRAKGGIAGYPDRWRDSQTLVFFVPPVTDSATAAALKAHGETSWLLAGYLADFEIAKSWSTDRARRGLSLTTPSPALTPEVMELQGELFAEAQRREVTELSPAEAREFLAKRGHAPAAIEATIRRRQAADPAHREAEERAETAAKPTTPKVTIAGLRVKEDKRPEAEPLVEEFTAPLRFGGWADLALKFTALDARQVAERMRRSGNKSVENARSIAAWHAKYEALPRVSATNAEEKRLSIALYTLWQDRPDLCEEYKIPVRPDRNMQNMQAILDFQMLHGALPRPSKSDSEEQRLATALESLRRNHPQICEARGVPLKGLKHGRGAENAVAIVAFYAVEGRYPRTCAEDVEERRLGRALNNMRSAQPALCTEHGIPLKADRAAAGRQANVTRKMRHVTA